MLFAMGYLEHPSICFLLPLAQINPSYLELYYGLKKHWSISQEVQLRHLTRRIWKLITYWRVHSNEHKDGLSGLAAANAKGNKLPVNKGPTITPEIWRQPRYLELFLNTLEGSR